MLLKSRWPKIVLGIFVVVLAGIALYQINEWWPGCNFVRGWYHSEPAGESLIVAAAKGGCTGCGRTLLKHGANPNIVNDVYVTPLVGAVQYGHYRTARLLLKAGANVNAGVGAGTALCQALMSLNSENPDDDMIELLVNSGASLQWTGNADIAHYSVFHCLHHSDSGPTPSVEGKRFAHLVGHGLVDVFNQLPEQDQSSLLLFLYDDEIKELSQHGARLNLDVRDSRGKTILALGPGVCNRVRLLVSEGAKYERQDAGAIDNCMNLKR